MSGSDATVVEETNARSGRGVYGISVASDLSGIGQQTLRLYESRGLLTPARTAGGTRRYSDDDLARLRRIAELVGVGINMAGIGEILGLEARNARLESDNSRLASDNSRLRSDNTQLKSDYALLAAAEGGNRPARGTTGAETKGTTTTNAEGPPPDGVPGADLAAQRIAADETVPLPDDDYTADADE